AIAPRHAISNSTPLTRRHHAPSVRQARHFALRVVELVDQVGDIHPGIVPGPAPRGFLPVGAHPVRDRRASASPLRWLFAHWVRSYRGDSVTSSCSSAPVDGNSR